MESPSPCADQNIQIHRGAQRNKGFYEYYQFLQSSEQDDDGEENGSEKEGELRGYTAGLYSPFGRIGQIKRDCGYTHEYILWGQPWVLFILEMADQARYVKGSPPEEAVTASSAADAMSGLRR